MKKHTLGLPLEYKKLPEYFDAWNINDSTQDKNAVIEKLLKEHNVKTVLDLTCGTGSQVFFLEKFGYQVTGADFSPALIEIARKRAQDENVDMKFIDGDMRTLKVGKFDAVITIDNAIGHVTKAGFVKTMKNIHHNLNDGGIYVFDILNLQAMTDQVVAGFAYYVHKQVDDTQILATQCSTLDREHGMLTSYGNSLIQKNANKPQNFSLKFSLQIYTAQEIQEMLAATGFQVIAHFGMDGEKFDKHTTPTILTVARKK